MATPLFPEPQQGSSNSQYIWIMERYDTERTQEEFRKFDDTAPAGVIEFYKLNHARQTREFVLSKKRTYTAKTEGEMGIWEAMERLNTLVDDSDPDTDHSQI